MTVNSVNLVGNLTREVELRRTQTGTAVMSMGIAVNNRRKNNQTGEWDDEPCFVDCVMFGERAEKLSGYMHKGDKVAVSGKLRYSSWEAKDGSGKKSKLDVIVDDIDFMTRQKVQDANVGGYPYGNSAPQGASQQGASQQGQHSSQQYTQQGYQQGYQQAPTFNPQSSVYDEDIPF